MQVLPARLRGLLRRYRVDRRLPPPVKHLFVETARLRRADAVARRKAAIGPVLGIERHTAPVGRLGDRRVATAGVLDASMSEHAVRTADTVIASLAAAGLEPFLVDRDGDQFVVGLLLARRPAAMAVLARELSGDGWFVRWDDRGRSGVVPAPRTADDRHTSRARAATVFRSMLVGELATGPELGVRLTYWELGTSGELELVGTRGHERFDARSPETVETVDGHRFPGRAAFPVAANLERLGEPVDVVYTWVDGADPAWQEAFLAAAAEHGRDLGEVALDPARYRSSDELRYSLRSIWMYCGWVRNIYVVTAGQRPAWLGDHERVTVVDHAEILPSDALPTFNSHSIESALHHIDGLAEQFVYFNDDMFVGRPLRPEVFFAPNGLARVFQSGARVPGYEDEHTLAVDTAARRGRELLLERFGRSVTHKPLHSPYPLRRSVLQEIDREFPDVMKATTHSRFRSPADLSVAASFAQHYALATGRAVLGEIRSEYVHVESGRLAWHLDRIRLADDIDTYCVNETQDRRGDHRERNARIRGFLDQMAPVAAPWERG